VDVPAQLSAEVDVLRSHGHEVTIVDEPPRFYVVISGLDLPDTYTPATTDLMFMADYQYPTSALDMFWTDPHVSCAATGAMPQNADLIERYIDRDWQRWSWHYTWNPSCHTLMSHLEVFFARLATAA
jgi:hypothetical protein